MYCYNVTLIIFKQAVLILKKRIIFAVSEINLIKILKTNILTSFKI